MSIRLRKLRRRELPNAVIKEPKLSGTEILDAKTEESASANPELEPDTKRIKLEQSSDPEPVVKASVGSEPDTLLARGIALFQRGSKTRSVIGRTDERSKVLSFIENSLKSSKGGVLYLTGLPGTGKSALASEIIKTFDMIPSAVLNCPTVEKPDLIYSSIVNEFRFEKKTLDKESAIKQLDEKFAESVSRVLVLDELDYLMTNEQDVIFRLFEWASKESSHLIIIGIANSIDLTDRLLPRLQTHNLVPLVIPFKPYTSADICNIVESRLKTLNKTPEEAELPLMHPGAVRLCASKTAANLGDLRKAFDICRRSLELLGERNSDGNLKDRVDVPLVAEVCHLAFGGVSSIAKVKALTFQQKAVLCILVIAERQAKAQNLTVNDIFQDYSRQCKMQSCLTTLKYQEFIQVIYALEAAGVASVTGICSKKGMGSTSGNRASRGGGGASSNRLSEGHREEFGHRKIASRVQVLDVMTGLIDCEPLKALLPSQLNSL